MTDPHIFGLTLVGFALGLFSLLGLVALAVLFVRYFLIGAMIYPKQTAFLAIICGVLVVAYVSGTI